MFVKLFFAAIELHAIAFAWSLPGLIPKNYEKYQWLNIFVGQLTSERTSFNFDFYSLKFCQNNKGKGYNEENYGKTLN